jgi:hypothetical protein
MKSGINSIWTTGVIILALTLSSCSGILYTSIDVLRPAKVTFPADANDILIINNARPQPHNHGHTIELFNENVKKINIDTDSLPVFTVASLARSISDKGFFRTVLFDHVSINQTDYFFTPTTPEETTIKSLAKKHKVNGIISLNRILVTDQVAELFDQERGTFIAFLEARYETLWSIHFPDRNQTFQIINKDTVYWESESNTRQKAFRGLPERRNALIDGALISGEKAVKSFIPYWEKEDRYLFTSTNKVFKSAIDSVYYRNWEAAAKLWESIYDYGSSFMKAKTAHNLAVANEFLGNLSKAYQFSKKATEHLSEIQLVDYGNFVRIFELHDNLRKRVAEEEKVKKQLAE